MLERHTRLLHKVWPEASGLFLTVSLCVFFFVSVSFLFFCLVDVFCCLVQSMQTPLFSEKFWLTMEVSDTSSTCTCSSLLTSLGPDDYDEHNMWKFVLGLLCHERVGAFMEVLF